MKIDKKDYFWLAGLAIPALLFLNIIIQAGMHSRSNIPVAAIEERAPLVRQSEDSFKESKVESPEVVFPQLELLGTLLGHPSAAFIYNPSTQASGIYKINDTIADAKIVSILPGKIILDKEGKQYDVFLVSRTRYASRDSESIVVKDDSGTIIISKFQMMAQMVKANELLSKVKILPLPGKTTNKLSGFRIDNVPSGSIIEEAGIKNGDIIFSIQGQQLQSMQDAFTMFNRIQNQPRIEVVLLREDKPVTLRYEIRN